MELVLLVNDKNQWHTSQEIRIYQFDTPLSDRIIVRLNVHMSETLTRNYNSIDFSLVAFDIQVSRTNEIALIASHYCNRLSIFVPISCNVLVAHCRYFLFEMA